MHTALVSEWGQAPKYVEADTPSIPPVESGDVQIKVLAAGLHRLVRARATGQHYSSKNLPHIPGVDGTGTTSEGNTVYFITIGTGVGSFSEVVNVPKRAVIPLPDGVDPYKAAGFVNPALSSWMALKKRTENLPPNFSVLIMGVTSASGVIAVSVAKALGASRIIGCARNPETLSTLGLDSTIVLQPKVDETDFSEAASVDVILDYMYGPPTEHLLRSVSFPKPVQYVHIGSVAGLDLTLPGSVLRSQNLTIRGSGHGSWSFGDMAAELPALLDAFRRMELSEPNRVPLSKVEETWSSETERMVFVP